MPNIALYVIIFAAVIVAIIFNYKKNINLGITTLVFAYIIGCFVMKMSVKDVVALTPVNIAFQLAAVTMFFSFASENGTMDVVANNILFRFRKQTWALPLVLLLIGILLGLIGCPNPMISVIIAVIGFPLAYKTGCNPILISIAAGLNGFASNIPYAQSGMIISGTVAEITGDAALGEAVAWKYFGLSAVFFIIVSLVFYFALKGYKVKQDLEIEKPEPATKMQKINLIIIAVIIIAVIIPNVLSLFSDAPLIASIKKIFDIQMLCIIGTLICIFLRLGSEKDAIRKGVPWTTIVMITGITVLLGVATTAGFTDWLGGLIGSNMAPVFIKPFLTLISGLLSFFAGGITAIFPMVAPTIPAIAETSGIGLSALFCSLAIGGNITTISPFSIGGATIMANCQHHEMHKKIFAGQLIVALVGLILAVLFSLIGFFAI